MRSKTASASVILALGAFAPAAAFPCGNAVMLKTDQAAKLVAKAETDLLEGRYRKALSRLYDGEIEVDSSDLERRISLVTSTARLRLGQVTDAAWSFDALHQAYPGDTIIETRLGETLSRLRTKVADAKALSLLESLEKRDLMADEYGFLALAKLRDKTADAEGRDRALTRCRNMAKDASMCTLSAPAKRSKRSAPVTKAYGDGPSS